MLVPLSSLKSGEIGIIKNISCGKMLFLKLSSMGIEKDVKVKVISNYGRGPIIIEVDNIKIALGRGICRKIWVNKIAKETRKN